MSKHDNDDKLASAVLSIMDTVESTIRSVVEDPPSREERIVVALEKLAKKDD